MKHNNYSSLQRPASSVQSGYALFVAVMVSSLILAIGLGLLGILEKKIILASTTRESTKAFYVADSGLECGLFWDRKHQGFGTTVFATSSLSHPPTSGVLCNGQDIAGSWTISDVSATAAKTSFTLPPQRPQSPFVLYGPDPNAWPVGVQRPDDWRIQFDSSYWNYQQLPQPSTNPFVLYGPDPNAWPVGVQRPDTWREQFDPSYWNYLGPSTSGSCARVEVLKSNGGRQTVVNSRGSSVCDISSPRVVERAIRAFY